MIMGPIVAIACTFVAGVAIAAQSPQEVARAKTSKWLWDQVHTHNILGDAEPKAEALVYMRETADLQAAYQLTTKEERGRFVHASLIKTAESSQASLRAWLKEHQVAFKPHWITNMIVLEDASASVLEEIAQRDDVLRVVGNPKVQQILPSTNLFQFDDQQFRGVGPGVARIGADKVWNELNVKGEGIVIAGQDTGVQWDHPALKKHYRGWDETRGNADHAYNWHDAIKEQFGPSRSSCGYDTAAPCDDHDHGTHTVGTIVGDDNAGNQIGVAPGAQWIACRNMDAGLGKPSTYIECFEFFLAPWKQGADSFKDSDPSRSPHVINNSWGCPKSEGCEGGEFEPILKALDAAGIFVVVSAGNEGSGCSTIQDGPAFNTNHVLSVGAMDHRTNKIAGFSSRGPSTYDNLIGPHVAAPGVDIRSSVRGSRYSSFGWSGTSMAGPHVVGQVALMWSANASLIGDIAKTKDLIMKSAEGKTEPSQTCGGVPGTAIPNNTWGHGIVDVLKSVKANR